MDSMNYVWKNLRIFTQCSAFLMRVPLSFSSTDFRRKQTRHLEKKLCERHDSEKSTAMKKKKPALKSFSDHLDEQFGLRGTKTREEYEQGFEAYKLGIMLQELRKVKGLTQQQLADRCGTTKNYISRIENDASDIRLSTLMRIVADGLGATLRLSVG